MANPFGRLFLTTNPLPLGRYIVSMWLLAFFPSIILATMVFLTLNPAEKDLPNFTSGPPVPPLILFISIALIGPLLETFLLALTLKVWSLVIRSSWKIVVASALTWAIVHSTAAPLWGLIVWWPFIVFSCAYITWRRFSWLKAIWAAFAIHALQNLFPAILIVLA